MPKSVSGKIRWCLAGTIFTVTTAVVVLSYFPWPGFKSCRQALDGENQIVDLCAPIGVNDAIAIALVLGIAAFLIWPELSELGIGNIISLKRRVEANEAKLDDTTAKTEKADDNIRALALATDPPAAEAIVRAQTGLAQATIVRPDVRRNLSSERASGESQLLSVAVVLDRIVATTSAASPVAAVRDAQASGLLPGGEPESVLRAVMWWARQYADELAIWARLRNILVHFPERLDDKQLEEGSKLAVGLLESARMSATSARESGL